MTPTRLAKVLQAHDLWLNSRGEQGARGDLSGEDLREANLVFANLEGAYLGNADMYKAFLADANLRGADLSGVNLTGSFLGGSNLAGANLRGATLTTAMMGHANLRGADLTNANLQGADLTGANLEGADLTNANLQGAELRGTLLDTSAKKKTAYGKKRRAVRDLLKSQGISAAAFKKQYPVAHSQIGKDIAGRPITEELVAAIVRQYGLDWMITETRYHSPVQRLSHEPNHVIQLNVDMNALTTDAALRYRLESIRQTSRLKGHPVVDDGNLFTVGWIRYDLDKGAGVLLIEEVQSGVPTARRGLKERETDVSTEDTERVFALLAPFVERFYFDAMALAFDVAYEHGVEVEMLTLESKAVDAPKSIYTDLPKAMGMKVSGVSKVLPDEGEVWRVKPNPARMPRRRR